MKRTGKVPSQVAPSRANLPTVISLTVFFAGSRSDNVLSGKTTDLTANTPYYFSMAFQKGGMEIHHRALSGRSKDGQEGGKAKRTPTGGRSSPPHAPDPPSHRGHFLNAKGGN
jgi:hypothetical protein